MLDMNKPPITIPVPHEGKVIMLPQGLSVKELFAILDSLPKGTTVDVAEGCGGSY